MQIKNSTGKTLHIIRIEEIKGDIRGTVVLEDGEFWNFGSAWDEIEIVKVE